MSEGAFKAYLDSNVFIYSVEGSSERAGPAQRLLETFRHADGKFVTSELSLAEVLAPAPEGVRRASSYRRKYLSLIVWNRSVDLIPVTRDILYETAEVRRFTRHKLPDAIHCATAVMTGCKYLVSGDRKMQRLPQGMTWLDVDDVAVETLLGATDG